MPPDATDFGGCRLMRGTWPVFVAQGLTALVTLGAALGVSVLLLAAIGVPPGAALASLATGALGSAEGIGYTLYYATNFIFAGLAVVLPARAGLFNIGGEGQAMLGGLLVALFCLAVPGWSWWAALPLALAASWLGGVLWALVPALMQVRRGSNLVITTILFNFLASKLTTWMLVDVIRAPGDPSPQTAGFGDALSLPGLTRSPLNLSFGLALAAAALAWLLVERMVWGYELRATGLNPRAARYAAIPTGARAIAAICLGGACAGMIGINEAMGVEHRLVLGFTAGAGFVGIAVALIARNHALGIIPAAILFGALSQGGAELSFDFPQVSRDIVIVLEGLVILFCGALEPLWGRPIAAWIGKQA
jgi:simple sugar transport system permease protein